MAQRVKAPTDQGEAERLPLDRQFLDRETHRALIDTDDGAVVVLAIPGIVPSMKNGEDESNVPRGMFDACLMPRRRGGDLTASVARWLDARAPR